MSNQTTGDEVEPTDQGSGQLAPNGRKGKERRPPGKAPISLRLMHEYLPMTAQTVLACVFLDEVEQQDVKIEVTPTLVTGQVVEGRPNDTSGEAMDVTIEAGKRSVSFELPIPTAGAEEVPHERLLHVRAMARRLRAFSDAVCILISGTPALQPDELLSSHGFPIVQLEELGPYPSDAGIDISIAVNPDGPRPADVLVQEIHGSESRNAVVAVPLSGPAYHTIPTSRDLDGTSITARAAPGSDPSQFGPYMEAVTLASTATADEPGLGPRP